MYNRAIAVVAQRGRRPGVQTVYNKVAAPPKRKTGGGGNNDDSNQDADGMARIRRYNIGLLHRCFYPQPEITQFGFLDAMTKRWGKPYKAILTAAPSKAGEPTFMAISFFKEQLDVTHTEDQTELKLIVDMLNTYGLGSEFIDFIKYDLSNVRDPSHMQQPFSVSINIPVTGYRLTEWNGVKN